MKNALFFGKNWKISNQDCMLPLVPHLLCHCLQNFEQYLKLAYVFSVRLKSFVIVLNSMNSCTM